MFGRARLGGKRLEALALAAVLTFAVVVSRLAVRLTLARIDAKTHDLSSRYLLWVVSSRGWRGEGDGREGKHGRRGGESGIGSQIEHSKTFR